MKKNEIYIILTTKIMQVFNIKRDTYSRFSRLVEELPKIRRLVQIL